MKKLRFFDSLKFVVAVVAATLILNVANAATLPAGYTGEDKKNIDKFLVNNYNSKWIFSIVN